MTEIRNSGIQNPAYRTVVYYFFMKIVSIVGARPQFIKAASVSRVIRNTPGIKEIILHTGQHYDHNMSAVFFSQLNISEPDYNLEVGSGSHAFQTGMMLKGIEEILIHEQPDCILIYGDTNSTLAGALAAVKLHLPVAHVEAGLRSFNRTMPEEINRIVADRISDLLFAPTQTAVLNLRKEGLEQCTRFTGDVMYDSVLYYRDYVLQHHDRYILPGLPSNFILATIHRAENTDHLQNLRNIFKAFGLIGQNIVLPLHPRTSNILKQNISVPNNVHLIEPVGYLEMIWLSFSATKIMTDSGGLQKEAYFLGKPCVTLRSETEWIETLHDNWNTLSGTNPDKIIQAINLPPPGSPRRNEFGEGNAALLTILELQKYLSQKGPC